MSECYPNYIPPKSSTPPFKALWKIQHVWIESNNATSVCLSCVERIERNLILIYLNHPLGDVIQVSKSRVIRGRGHAKYKPR